MAREEKTIKEKILDLKNQTEELKKRKMLEILQDFITNQKKKEKRAIVFPNPNSQYRSIYLTYLKYKKKYPNQLPSLRELWKEK